MLPGLGQVLYVEHPKIAPQGYEGSAHETEGIPLTEYFPIFRVPEYSELLIRTDSRSRWNQERGVAELGIFLAANLAPAVDAYCSSAKF
jgi:hypothetical protein